MHYSLIKISHMLYKSKIESQHYYLIPTERIFSKYLLHLKYRSLIKEWSTELDAKSNKIF